jgi:MFS family permease
MTPDQPPASAGPAAALPLVVAGFVISFVVIGGGIDTVSVFLNAIAIATDWSRSGLSLGVSVGAVMAAVSTPVVGALVDRHGVRVPMVAGVGLLAVGFSILAAMHAPWQFVVANVFLGPGFAACALLPITVAVTLHVPERTALALGIVGAGASAGALVLAPVAQAVIQTLGWRGTYLAMGVAIVFTPLPFLLFALPRGRLRARPTSASATAVTAGQPNLRRELRQPGVLPLAAVMILPGLTAFSVSVHLVPYLVGLGHSAATAAAALGATVGISAIGKIAGGFMGDRFGVLRILRLALLLDVVSLAFLQHAGGLGSLAGFVVLYGLALGTQIAVIPMIAVSVIGTARFGTLFGILQLAAMLAAAVGPIASGLIFDATGRYNGAVVLWLASMVGAAMIAWSMKTRESPAEAVL